MKPQFPYKTKYIITQGYSDNANSYPEGHHGGLDIVPLDEQWRPAPIDIYPLFNGSTISIADTSNTRGKGIKERVNCDADFIKYLKKQGVVPKDYQGEVTLEILYWHVLKILDYDGTLTKDTPIAVTGNTGYVVSGGKPVPDNMKGVPPYPGLHLHLETVLKGNKTFNLDKDVKGRIDPNIIFGYTRSFMLNKVKVNLPEGKTAYGVAVITPNMINITLAEDEVEWRSYGKADGYDVATVDADGKTNWSVDTELTFK